MRKLTFVLFCTSILCFNACKKFEDINEIDRIDYNPEFAVPLINSSLSLDDIIEFEESISFLDIASDGSMSLQYSKDEVEQQADELIQELQDFPLVLVDSVMNVPINLFDNLEVRKLRLKTGTLSFNLESSHTEDLDVRIIFPGITQNGQAFEMQTSIDYQGSTPLAVPISPQPVGNYEIEMPNGMLEVQYEAFNNQGQRVLLDMVSGEARDWTYDHIEGIWDQESFLLKKDTIEVDLFENWVEGTLSFVDPKLILNLSNSIGFPTQLRLENMMAYTAEGNSIPFTSMLSDGYNINYPTLSAIGEEVTSQIILDKNNSNIISVFKARPQFITYEIRGTINPENSNEIGFVAESSTLKGGISLEVPVYGTASGFTFEEDSELELDEIEDISYAEFKLITNNSIPLDLSIQLYFLDENDSILDSLFETRQDLLAAPEIGANGTVLTASEQVNIVEVTQERFDRIRSAKEIRVQAAVSTANEASVPVRIFSHQKVEVKMGAKIGIDQ